jgi:hypothetical protein
VAIVLALGQDRRPGKAGLGAFQDKHLKKGAVVMAWHAPLLVVVLDIKRITSPGAALKMFGHVATVCRTIDRSHIFPGKPSHGCSVSSWGREEDSVTLDGTNAPDGLTRRNNDILRLTTDAHYPIAPGGHLEYGVTKIITGMDLPTIPWRSPYSLAVLINRILYFHLYLCR